MKKLLALSVVLLMNVCAVLQSAAMTMQRDTVAPFSGKVYALEGVTITETQRRHTLTAPAPFHMIDRSDMHVMGVTDMADALHRLPGITLRDYGGAGGMKTVSVRGFGAKHTGVSYDGVMLSDCQSGEIDLSRYSLDNVSHLSLTVGDNDDIFMPARNATTPAMLSIQTIALPTGDSQPHLTAQLKAGSFGYISPFVRYEQNFSNRLAFSAVGEYTYAENDYPYTIQNGTETISDHRKNSRMNSGHAELNLVYLINNSDRLSAKVYYYDNDRQLPGQVHYYTNISGETLHDRNAFGQLTYQTRWRDRWSLKVLGKYNWNESVYKDKLYQGGVNDASYWQREAYASAALLYTPDEHWALDYSADYSYNNLNGSSMRTVVGLPYRHTVLQSATAKYRCDRLTVMGRLLGSLYLNDAKEGSSARNMRRLSPSLSLSYKLMADHDFYVRASYKNIFRSPTFNECYYYHYGSPDLKPESTDQWNLGLTYNASYLPLSSKKRGEQSTLTVTVDGYYNRVRDMIVAVPKNMFVWSCINVGKVQVLGFDATMRGCLPFNDSQRLTLSGSYSYQQAQNVTNPESPYYKNQIAYIPKHTFSASAGYENPLVNLSVHAVGMSMRWANNEHYEGTSIKAFTDCGLTLWRTFRWGRCQIEGRLDVKNLFNTQYEIVLFYPMPGRSYQLSALFMI